MPPELREQILTFLRQMVTRNGDDPRLLTDIKATEDIFYDRWKVKVILRDGRSAEAVVLGDPLHDARRFVTAYSQACGEAYGQPVPPADPGFATSGLPSDYWWNEIGMTQAEMARRWVRLLLRRPDLSGAHADRFIASLDPPKRDDLIRRARDGIGVEGF